MPDITMCKNETCPLRDNCYRFTAEPSLLQSYFIDKQPVINEDGSATCNRYWPLIDNENQRR